jgi:hypothetical protein
LRGALQGPKHRIFGPFFFGETGEQRYWRS